jgi:hypothetical protein
MEIDLIKQLALLRMTIGYLGEREQFGWWQSSFFTQGSNAFLSPVFIRTQTLAQCNGVTRAATLVHDERIGVGNVYHLFRLPEKLEQDLHQAMHDTQLEEQIQKIIATKDSALGYLRNNSIIPTQPSAGPVRAGDTNALRDIQVWSVVAGFYLVSFETGIEILPYFSDLT